MFPEERNDSPAWESSRALCASFSASNSTKKSSTFRYSSPENCVISATSIFIFPRNSSSPGMLITLCKKSAPSFVLPKYALSASVLRTSIGLSSTTSGAFVAGGVSSVVGGSAGGASGGATGFFGLPFLPSFFSGFPSCSGDSSFTPKTGGFSGSSNEDSSGLGMKVSVSHNFDSDKAGCFSPTKIRVFNGFVTIDYAG